jgi:hypothetical protein
MFGATIGTTLIYHLSAELAYGSFSWRSLLRHARADAPTGATPITASNIAHLQEYQEVSTAVDIEQARKGYT